jgi:hypothetical protein
MIIKFIFTTLFSFSIILNVLFYFENERLNGEVQRHFFKRMNDEFEKMKKKEKIIIKKYPIIV